MLPFMSPRPGSHTSSAVQKDWKKLALQSRDDAIRFRGEAEGLIQCGGWENWKRALQTLNDAVNQVETIEDFSTDPGMFIIQCHRQRLRDLVDDVGSAVVPISESISPDSKEDELRRLDEAFYSSIDSDNAAPYGVLDKQIKILEQSPISSHAAHRYLGYAHEECVKKSIDGKTDPGAEITLREHIGRYFHERGLSYEKQGKNEVAHRYYTYACSLCPADAFLRLSLVMARYMTSDLSIEFGNTAGNTPLPFQVTEMLDKRRGSSIGTVALPVVGKPVLVPPSPPSVVSVSRSASLVLAAPERSGLPSPIP